MAKKKVEFKPPIEEVTYMRTEGFEIGDMVNLIGTKHHYIIVEIKDGMYHLSNNRNGVPIFRVAEHEIKLKEEESQVEHITETERDEAGVCGEESCEIGD